MRKKKAGLLKKLLVVGIVVFVGVPLLAMLAGVNPPQKQGESKAKEQSNIAKTSSKEKVIPGLFPVDVYMNLEKLGYEVEKTGRSYPRWICKLNKETHNVKVEIHSEDASSVAVISATFMNFGDESKTNQLAAAFLGYIATVPYENANPVRAKQWVEQHIGETSETVISGVKFQIIANPDVPRVRILRISAAQ